MTQDFIVSVLLTVGLYALLIRVLFSYRLSEQHLQVLLLGLPLVSIDYKDISSISLARSTRIDFFRLYLITTLWGDSVVVNRKNSMLNILITPKNPDEFIAQVKERMKTEISAIDS